MKWECENYIHFRLFVFVARTIYRMYVKRIRNDKQQIYVFQHCRQWRWPFGFLFIFHCLAIECWRTYRIRNESDECSLSNIRWLSAYACDRCTLRTPVNRQFYYRRSAVSACYRQAAFHRYIAFKIRFVKIEGMLRLSTVGRVEELKCDGRLPTANNNK